MASHRKCRSRTGSPTSCRAHTPRRTVGHVAVEVAAPGGLAGLAIIDDVEAQILARVDAVPSRNTRQSAGEGMHEGVHQIDVAAVGSQLRIVLNRDRREHTGVRYLI